MTHENKHFIIVDRHIASQFGAFINQRGGIHTAYESLPAEFSKIAPASVASILHGISLHDEDAILAAAANRANILVLAKDMSTVPEERAFYNRLSLRGIHVEPKSSFIMSGGLTELIIDTLQKRE